MVKNVFWGFVYAEKLDQENKEQDLSTGSKDREHRHSAGQKDLFLFTGWILQFRLAKVAWKKIEFKPRKKKLNRLMSLIKTVKSLEEK